MAAWRVDFPWSRGQALISLHCADRKKVALDNQPRDWPQRRTASTPMQFPPDVSRQNSPASWLGDQPYGLSPASLILQGARAVSAAAAVRLLRWRGSVPGSDRCAVVADSWLLQFERQRHDAIAGPAAGVDPLDNRFVPPVLMGRSAIISVARQCFTARAGPQREAQPQDGILSRPEQVGGFFRFGEAGNFAP